ncbi:drebrin-like b isoform X5 [Conger conger]|uniref:drebrin-like b isoform X5 n=1 Tax=Conger conger TaxID=82655 RepID=UPI002A59CBAD|nr:drebrin-like b isoform X5 [Conger conger]
MAVNLSKNGPALTAAYKEVVDEKSNTNWALFTYEGNSNDIRLAEKGDGGLEELVEELNSGKIMYAFCRVLDPNSGLPKYVLINWTGEGVKDSRKGLCANHVSSMANFLKGAHVTVNARGEEDVEPEVIMQKVAKASGANYSFHKESSRFRDSGPQGPVGSVYQKTNAMSEIKRTNKDTFWAQAEKDEEKRRQEERKRVDVERQHLEQERKDREVKEAAQRDKKDKERANQIDQQKKYQRQQEAENRDQERHQWEEQEKEFQADQRKGIKRGESVEKAQAPGPVHTTVLCSGTDPLSSQEAASLISQRSMNPRDMFKQRERGVAPDNREAPPSPQPVVQAEPEEPAAVNEQCYDSPSHEVDPPAAEVYEPAPEADDIYDEPAQAEEPKSYEDPAEDTASRGICARALYDYQAADDTEISFDPDEVITGIEMIDEGWWRGYSPDGRFGMFPANYVELL